jgi:hypothetical protein
VLSVIIPSRTWESGQEAVARVPAGADEILLVVGQPVHPGHMRNLGAKEAKGDVLCFVDDDVLLHGDLGYLREAPVHQTWWTASQFRDTTGDKGSSAMASWWTAAGHMGVWSGTVGCFIACRRGLFNAVGGFPFRYVGEDAGIGEAFYKAGAKLYVAPVVVDLLRASPFVTKGLAQNHKFMAMERPERLPFQRYLPLAQRAMNPG